MSEPNINGILIKIQKEYRWCTAVLNNDGSVYSYKDILNGKSYPPGKSIIIKRSIVRMGIIEQTKDEEEQI
jgi:hypothetical protein